MGRRVAQLNKELGKNLAKILEEMDFSPAQLVTVTEVTISSLLDQARVSIGVFPSRYEKETLAKIKDSKGKIKQRLAQLLRIKKMPEVNFYLDKGLAKAARVEEILSQLEKGWDGTVAKK